jgi:AraC-like DNA-binding protein
MACHDSYPVLPELAPHVLAVWSVRHDEGVSYCPVLPDPSVILTFGRATWLEAGVARASGERARVLGVLRRPWRVAIEDGFLLGVTLRPGAVPAFFDEPAWELTDTVRPLQDTWGSSARVLEQTLAGRSPSAAALAFQEALLGERRSARRERWIEHAGARRGLVTVDELARLSGRSRQHLARRARETVGVGPKLLCRLTRFQQALELVERQPGGDWATAARRLGYVDQSHLSAEFREFTGLPPARFAAAR